MRCGPEMVLDRSFPRDARRGSAPRAGGGPHRVCNGEGLWVRGELFPFEATIMLGVGVESAASSSFVSGSSAGCKLRSISMRGSASELSERRSTTIDGSAMAFAYG